MPKKVRKKSAFTNKSAKKSAFTNKSAQKSTLKSTFGSSEPICPEHGGNKKKPGNLTNRWKDQSNRKS